MWLTGTSVQVLTSRGLGIETINIEVIRWHPVHSLEQSPFLLKQLYGQAGQKSVSLSQYKGNVRGH